MPSTVDSVNLFVCIYIYIFIFICLIVPRPTSVPIPCRRFVTSQSETNHALDHNGSASSTDTLSNALDPFAGDSSPLRRLKFGRIQRHEVPSALSRAHRSAQMYYRK